MVHGDPQGQARAGKLLHHLRPDLVTVEISPFSLRYRLQHGGRWQRQLTAALTELPAGAERHLAIQRPGVPRWLCPSRSGRLAIIAEG